jgi:chromosome segregation ATPase
MSLQDPFLMFKDEVQQQLRTVSATFDRWKELHETENTATNPEFKWTDQQLIEGLKNLEGDLGDIAESISIVEQNTSTFKLSKQDIDGRKEFVRESRQKLDQMRSYMMAPKTVAKIDADKRAALVKQPSQAATKGSGSSAYSRLDAAVQADNQRAIDDDGTQLQLVIDQQDGMVDQIRDGVAQLRNIATDIDQTLDEHATMLEQLDKAVDRTSHNLREAMKKVNKLLKETDRGQIAVIVFLFLVLVGLTVVVFGYS